MSFFAAETLISVPNGAIRIADLAAGDTVSIWKNNTILQDKLSFSGEIAFGIGPLAVYLRTETAELVIAPEQKMLLDDQTLKEAQLLVPNEDRLLRADGQAENILAIDIGYYNQRIYSLAVNNEPHLIIANGLVCGDFFTSR